MSKMLPNLYFSLFKLVYVFKNVLSPKKLLEEKMKYEVQKIYHNCHITFTSNGRSAIYLILQYLKKREETEVCFPKYICTAVEKAILKADLTPKKTFEDSIPCILLYGQHIICDNAQSIDTICQNDFVILTFNKKDIWAELGGAIVSKKRIQIKQQKLSLKQELHYVWVFLNTLIHYLSKKQVSTLKYEYSPCEGFFYGFNNREISKISLATALVSIKELVKYKKRRTRNYEAFKKWVRLNRSLHIVENSPTRCYITCEAKDVLRMVKIFHQLGLKTKMAYAVTHNPHKSLKPQMIHILNHPRQDFHKILGVEN